MTRDERLRRIEAALHHLIFATVMAKHPELTTGDQVTDLRLQLEKDFLNFLEGMPRQ